MSDSAARTLLTLGAHPTACPRRLIAVSGTSKQEALGTLIDDPSFKGGRIASIPAAVRAAVPCCMCRASSHPRWRPEEKVAGVEAMLGAAPGFRSTPIAAVTGARCAHRHSAAIGGQTFGSTRLLLLLQKGIRVMTQLMILAASRARSVRCASCLSRATTMHRAPAASWHPCGRPRFLLGPRSVTWLGERRPVPVGFSLAKRSCVLCASLHVAAVMTCPNRPRRARRSLTGCGGFCGLCSSGPERNGPERQAPRGPQAPLRNALSGPRRATRFFKSLRWLGRTARSACTAGNKPGRARSWHRVVLRGLILPQT